MKHGENPFFVTQRKLVHREGVLAAVILAGILGLSFFSGLLVYRWNPRETSAHTISRPGDTLYGCVVALELLILVIGGFGRISERICTERKSGLWDSNCLAPRRPRDMVWGYWLGAPLREVYMAVILAIWGLGIILVAGMPFRVWLLTQLLIVSTSLFFGLLAVLVAISGNPRRGGMVIWLVLVLLLSQIFLQYAARRMITNYIFPVYPLAWSFRGWHGEPSLPFFTINPVIVTLGVQLVLGIFLWRAAIRRIADPFLPVLGRWEALALYCTTLFLQSVLVWTRWHGQFGRCAVSHGFGGELAVIQGYMMLLGIVLLTGLEANGAWPRRVALCAPSARLRSILSVSAVPSALALGIASAIAILSQCMFSLAHVWKVYVVATGNVMSFFLAFVLLLEYCRLRFGRQGLGFFMLWLFILCVFPFILSIVLNNSTVARLSLLAPGISVLADPAGRWANFALLTVLAHFAIVALLLLFWYRQWRRVFTAAAGRGISH